MKTIVLFLITSLLVSFCFADTSEVPMIFTGNDTYPNSRLWLPCSAGLCMIDLAGSGTVVNITSFSQNLEKITSQTIKTLQGQKNCDLVSVPNFNLAGKDFSSLIFNRCDWFPSDSSPMLGANFFRDTAFALSFSKNTFSWLSSDSSQIASPVVILTKLGPWFSFDIQIGSEPAKAILDSGAPLTIVDTAFYNSHPELFTQSTTVSDEAELNQPLVINGNTFTDKKVQIADLKAQFAAKAPDVFIGMNHLHQADWQIDYPHLQFHLDLLPQ